MKKLFLTLLAALAGGYVALAALAADSGMLPGTIVPSGSMTRIDDENHLRWTVLVPELYNTLYVAGTIAAIDNEAGMIRLNTDAQGMIDLQFKPEALGRFKVGDVVVVNLGFAVDDRTISAESCEVLPIKVASC